MLRTIFAFGTATLLATPAVAEGFQRIQEKDRFLSVLEDRDLRRFGINVKVTGEGDIVGRAFGQSVSGDWEWRQGYFCRSLFWGSQNLGDNCQLVEVRGETVRFTSDQGTGQSADLRIN